MEKGTKSDHILFYLLDQSQLFSSEEESSIQSRRLAGNRELPLTWQSFTEPPCLGLVRVFFFPLFKLFIHYFKFLTA